MRKSVYIILFSSIGALLFVVAANWNEIKKAYHQMSQPSAENASLQKAEFYFENGELDLALDLIHRNESALDYHTDTGKKWVDLLIEISRSTDNVPQMISLYEHFPEAFNSNEKASLIVANGFLLGSRSVDFELLRDKWKNRENRLHDWLVLDADLLILRQERTEAIALLQSQTFNGKDDTGRLVRLALLSIPENSNVSWDFLTSAHSKDPQNPDIHTYRAGLLESAGKNSSALTEYMAAVKSEPENILLKDQLAEFYLRNNDYFQAMTVWLEAFKESAYEPILVKALFWNHVMTPIHYDWNSISIPKGQLQPFIRYLIDLPQAVFWNENIFDRIQGGQRFLTTQPMTVWLRLLQDLKEKKESEADYLFQFNPQKTAMSGKKLAKALQRILVYRKYGTLKLDVLNNPLANDPLSENIPRSSLPPAQDFFAELEWFASLPSENGQSHLPADLHALLNSPEAFMAAFLSAGWFEAALQLHWPHLLPNSFPDWVAVKMTQALRVNRNDEAALAFAAVQKPSDQLLVSIVELLDVVKNTGSVIESLQEYAKESTDAGMRASKMIALLYVGRKEYALAEKTIETQPLLANDISGKELKARIALLKGNDQVAVTIYTAIQSHSTEAKSFLAQRAFAAKDWNKAKALTEDLIQIFPDNSLLQENLKKIVSEQAAPPAPS